MAGKNLNRVGGKDALLLLVAPLMFVNGDRVDRLAS